MLRIVSMGALKEEGFTVLLVEGDPDDATRLEAAFSELDLAEVLRTVTSLDSAIQYLAGKGTFADRSAYPLPSLILISLALSRTSDFKLLRWMRRQGLEIRRIPAVVLAASRQPPGSNRPTIWEPSPIW
jgi:CheY-like chemotaxis protein